MAAQYWFRLAVSYGAGATIAAWRLVQGPGLDNVITVNDWIRRNLGNPAVSDAELEQEFRRLNNMDIVVTTVTGEFEVRRIQLEWSVTGTSVLDEDVRVCTWHAIKLSGGQPVNTWDQVDFDGMVTRFHTFWSAIDDWFSSGLHLTSIKFYRAGPNVVPPQPPVFESVTDLPGASASPSLPPQSAISVTEKAGQKKNWGRFYLPSVSERSSSAAASLTASGRPTTPLLTAIADAADSLYESALTANVPFCVYRPHLDANRPTGSPPEASNLPERPANAATVEQLQVDDVFDVIRRRRWENPTLRIQRQVGAAATQLPAPIAATAATDEAPPAAQTP